MFEVVTLKEGKTVCLTTYIGLVTLCVCVRTRASVGGGDVRVGACAFILKTE